MARRLAFVLVLTLIFLAFATAWKNDFFWSTAEMAPTERPIVVIKARVLDLVNRYFEDNRLYGRTEVTGLNRKEKQLEIEADDAGVDYIVARAGDRYTDDPGGVILSYDHPVCPFILPAGRQFKFGFSGGMIEDVDAIFPLEPMPWDAMQTELRKLIVMLDTSGWVRTTGKYTPSQQVKDILTFDDFLNKTGPKWASVGFWAQCDNPDIKLYLQVRHYNSSASGSFMPPAALSAPLDPTAEDTFLFRISISPDYLSPTERELNALRNARREVVNGDEEKALPLTVWLDDPDWRPEGWDGKIIK